MPYVPTTTIYHGTQISTAAAETDDKARIDNGDPKTTYLAGARIFGMAGWLCANDPTTAANWGISCPVISYPDPGANGPGT
jgi:hypothetical protein